MSKATSGKHHDWFDMYIEATANAREAGYMFYNMLTTYENCEEDFAGLTNWSIKATIICMNSSQNSRTLSSLRSTAM